MLRATWKDGPDGLLERHGGRDTVSPLGDASRGALYLALRPAASNGESRPPPPPSGRLPPLARRSPSWVNPWFLHRGTPGSPMGPSFSERCRNSCAQLAGGRRRRQRFFWRCLRLRLAKPGSGGGWIEPSLALSSLSSSPTSIFTASVSSLIQASWPADRSAPGSVTRSGRSARGRPPCASVEPWIRSRTRPSSWSSSSRPVSSATVTPSSAATAQPSGRGARRAPRPRELVAGRRGSRRRPAPRSHRPRAQRARRRAPCRASGPSTGRFGFTRSSRASTSPNSTSFTRSSSRISSACGAPAGALDDEPAERLAELQAATPSAPGGPARRPAAPPRPRRAAPGRRSPASGQPARRTESGAPSHAASRSARGARSGTASPARGAQRLDERVPERLERDLVPV